MRIVVISGPEACGPFLLREGDNPVGRESTCVVALPSKRVSRRHATLRVQRGQVTVVDEGSQNGVLDAQGQRISNRALAARERFQVGDYVLSLEAEGADDEIDLEDDANDPPTDEVALRAAQAAASWGGGGDPLRNASPRVAGSSPRNAPAAPLGHGGGGGNVQAYPEPSPARAAPPRAQATQAPGLPPPPPLAAGPRSDAFPPMAAPRSATPAPWPPPPSGAPAAPPPAGPPSAGARPRMPMKPGAAPFTAPPRPVPPRIGDPDPDAVSEQSLTPVAPNPAPSLSAPPLPPPRPMASPAAAQGQAAPPPFPPAPGRLPGPAAPPAPRAFEAPADAPAPAWGAPPRGDSAPAALPTSAPSQDALVQRAPWWALTGGSLAATMGGFLLVAGLQVQGATEALQEASLLRAEEIADALGNRNASAIAEQRGLAYDVAFVSDRAGVRGAMLADARGMVLAPTDKLRTSVTGHGAWKEAAQARRAARVELDDGVWEVVTPVRADIGGSGARTVVGYAIVEYDPRVVVDAVYTPGLRWLALVVAALAASAALTAAGWFLLWRPLHQLRDETEFALRGSASNVHAPSSLPPFAALAHSINRVLTRIPRGGPRG